MNTKQARQMKLIFVSAIAILVALLAIPLVAQDGGTAVTYPANTITVTGSGSASGTPDIANLVIGVEIFNSDLAVAFEEANGRIDAIVAAVVEAGVDRDDIRTMGLNVFIDRSFGPGVMMESGLAGEQPQQQPQNYVVSNQLNLTIRDITKVADVINAGVEAGANNLFGLDFRIDDTAALESDARVEAMADARARAEHLAEIAGVTLGDAIVITEGGFGGFGPFPNNAVAQDMAGGFGGGASVEPGRLSVSMAVTVTYTIAR